MGKQYNLPCNIAKTLDLIGDRWTLLIIRELMTGRKKFNEMKEELKGIAPNILSERLKALEEAEIVTSDLYLHHPPRLEYELTKKGKDLKHVLNAIAIWGNQYFDKKYFEVVHSECNHEVEITYHCPHCKNNTSDYHYKFLEN
ncbi:winged helix-turn-helix transcriptional regulator [Neobacillus sp. D3-1R]|uniref:winged helix-turn-helix transcriptional regulator n=1 Tax=Neobacillus sp. D3-1R TaxID=3445778 RepID=UPI003F9F294D